MIIKASTTSASIYSISTLSQNYSVLVVNFRHDCYIYTNSTNNNDLFFLFANLCVMKQLVGMLGVVGGMNRDYMQPFYEGSFLPGKGSSENSEEGERGKSQINL